MPWGVAAAAVGAIGAGISASGASSAAGAQSKAANNAAAQNLAEFQLNYNTENPFVTLGYDGRNQLSDLMASGQMSQTPWQYRVAEDALNRIPQSANLPNAPTLPNAPQPMTQAQLEATPGYQFNLSQGLKATQSAAAAKGLGVSGAALKGAATYATGLADSTYQNQFNNAQQIYSDLFNNAQQGYNNQFQTAQQGFLDQSASANQQATGFMNMGQAQTNRLNQMYTNLLGTASLGQNAAAQVGNQGVASAANSGNFLTQAGNAQAAGAVGGANALTGALGGTFNQLQGQQQLYNQSNGQYGSNIGGFLNNLFGSSGAGDTGSWTTPAFSSSQSVY